MEQEDQRADFIVGQGEMADRIRRKDWSRTPVGAIDAWPQSLRAAVGLCLASNFPISILWGPEHTQIYNDAYRVLCGDVHPRALGEPCDATWASAWPAVGELLARALDGEASFLENQRMFITRNGGLEETFFTLSLSPIRAEDGSVGGIFHPVIETTATMLAERRTRALRDLSGALDAMAESQPLEQAVLQALQPFEFDLPMLMFYALDEQAQCYRLAANRGFSALAQQELAVLPLDADGPWPIRQALRARGLTQVESLPASLATESCGLYPEPPARAVMLPIVVRGSAHPPLLLVAVPSPRLPFDESYRHFLQLLASSVAGQLGSMRAQRAEAALREAQKLEAVGRLTGGVAHDFNNLMMVVAGGVSVLERQPDAARQRTTLDGMRRAVERGSALTRQLLTFSGGKQLAAQPIDLAGALRGTQLLLNRTLGGKVRVMVHHSADLWPVLADPGALETVLLNLGMNARDGMPSGGTVSITADNISNPHGLSAGDYVRISVSDTGVGMAPEARERAFDPFFTTQDAGKGSGVALAPVYGFCKDSGGTAEIDSAPGRGTTVSLLLPRSPVQPAAPVEQISTGDPKPLAVNGHRVLLVEDDTEVAELVAEMLEHLGYKPLRATTAAEALFTLEHDTRIDLVFSDVMMPGKLNGVDLARRVHRDHPEIPVILTSGYAESFKQEARSAGVLLLPKPYAMDELGAMVERALQARVH